MSPVRRGLLVPSDFFWRVAIIWENMPIITEVHFVCNVCTLSHEAPWSIHEALELDLWPNIFARGQKDHRLYLLVFMKKLKESHWNSWALNFWTPQTRTKWSNVHYGFGAIHVDTILVCILFRYCCFLIKFYRFNLPTRTLVVYVWQLNVAFEKSVTVLCMYNSGELAASHSNNLIHTKLLLSLKFWGVSSTMKINPWNFAASNN